MVLLVPTKTDPKFQDGTFVTKAEMILQGGNTSTKTDPKFQDDTFSTKTDRNHQAGTSSTKTYQSSRIVL